LTPTVPDVTAYELPHAQEVLLQAGWSVGRITETGPPRAVGGRGVARVARVRVIAPGEVELVVVFTQYDRATQERGLRY
jgi:hypothetical protein